MNTFATLDGEERYKKELVYYNLVSMLWFVLKNEESRDLSNFVGIFWKNFKEMYLHNWESIVW